MIELYRKYRPCKFSQVLGCEETAQSMENMLKAGKLPHTTLLTGPSGCGKTTLARIATKQLGCSEHDCEELDAAVYRGIDSIRDIRQKMSRHPIAGPVRAFILDEVHMLTKEAQGAMLKMTEDTPSHVYFFLCTTDPQKLLPTILTRCNPMPVRLLTERELEKLLERVCAEEKIELTKKDTDALTLNSMGSARMLLVLLHKVMHLKPNQRASAIESKLAEDNEAIDLCRALIKRLPWTDVGPILRNLKGDAENTRYAVMAYARAVLLSKGDFEAYAVIKAFSRNFYDSKDAGLAMACYEALNTEQAE